MRRRIRMGWRGVSASVAVGAMMSCVARSDEEPVFVEEPGTTVGELSSVVALWGYETHGERERRRAELQRDERWQSLLARLQPLLHTQWNRILVPTSFSPIR